ncbi:MAG: hypothetical protein LBK66_01060 [Spirochaetaceae bacterium]|jgi:hypothetical protein|nr:hypothetical protein [Spirochaetaceae bacterium]
MDFLPFSFYFLLERGIDSAEEKLYHVQKHRLRGLKMRCRICGNDRDNKDYYVKDYELGGGRDTFHYFQCHSCKCLQIAEIPADMSIYYNSGYSSFETPDHGIINKLRLTRDSHLISRGGGG